MDTFVRNVISDNITLCDLNNVLLVPGQVVNLLNYATQAQIDASQDLATSIANGLVQLGKWRVSAFAITQYNKPADRSDLDNIATATIETLSGYPLPCDEQIPIDVTTRLHLEKDPQIDVDAANKKYVDDSISHAHDGDIIIGGDLTVHGDAEVDGILTAPSIVTQQITGAVDSSGACQLDINCNLNVSTGATGTFTSSDGKTVTVRNGIVVEIS